MVLQGFPAGAGNGKIYGCITTEKNRRPPKSAPKENPATREMRTAKM